MTEHRKSISFLKWFDPRNRQIGTWGFILNRITALGLSLYLILHMVMLYKLTQGAEAYNTFIAFAKTPAIKAGELLVIAAGIFHGLNGIRIFMNSLGIGTRHHKTFLIVLVILSFLILLYFAFNIFFLD